MITITRRLAGDLHGMIRRLPGVATHGTGPPLCFAAGPKGLSVRCRTAAAALKFRQPGRLAPHEVHLPWPLIQQIAGRHHEPVTLEQTGTRVTARWQTGRVLQEMRYDLSHHLDCESAAADPLTFDPGTVAAIAGDLPPLPSSMAENSPRLLTALRAAARTTDQQPTNGETTSIAVNCLQLRGGIGVLAATDRIQLLVQRGFEFPWQGERLIRSSRLFGCRALSGRHAPRKNGVAIGATDAWVTLRIGRWTVWLAVVQDALYPHLDDVLRDTDRAIASCQLTRDEARFLTQTIPRLPADAIGHAAITLDLTVDPNGDPNGGLRIRSQPPDGGAPTELVLSRASVTGMPLRVNTDRKYLVRASQLGLRNIALFGPAAPVVCHDRQRYYIWMVLDAAGIVPNSPDAVQVISPTAADQPATSAMLDQSKPVRHRLTTIRFLPH